jgi:stage II sporulation protein AA (anti-sigma F factor antagonist)
VSGHQPTPFSVDVADRDGRVVVTVEGELDLATAGDVEAVVLPAVRDGRHAVLDLRRLEFMDSSGVRVLVAAHGAAGESGGRLSVVRSAPGSAVQRVLEISGLEGILELVDDT